LSPSAAMLKRKGDKESPSHNLFFPIGDPFTRTDINVIPYNSVKRDSVLPLSSSIGSLLHWQ